MSSRPPLFALGVLAAAAATAAAATGATPAPPIAGTSHKMAILRPCAAALLTAAVTSDAGAMMHRELRITLTNGSTTPCAMYGYPAVRLLDETKHPRIVAESFSGKPKLFIIAPKQQASFLLRIATGDGVTTYPTVPTLAIIPPGDVAPLFMSVNLPAAPTIDVTALLPAADVK